MRWIERFEEHLVVNYDLRVVGKVSVFGEIYIATATWPTHHYLGTWASLTRAKEEIEKWFGEDSRKDEILFRRFGSI